MSPKETELILNNVLLALQVSLGLWQFMKLTLVRALIQGVVGWLLRPLRLSRTYSRLQHCGGRVFKKAKCFVLQADIPSQRRRIEADGLDTICVWYLGRRFLLQRRGNEGNMLFINEKMCYYITPTIWEELLTFGEALPCGVDDPEDAATVDACADAAAVAPVFLKGYRQCWKEVPTDGVMPFDLFVKVYRHCYRRCWEGVMTGGVMTFNEVVDEIILHNQHVSNCLHDHLLLPINLSVSDEQFLKFLNLAGFFLHGKVHWLIPTSLSFISAVMEFITTLRVWLYAKINMWLCYKMHSKSSNDKELQSERAITRVIIAGGAKIDKEGATLVPWLHVAEEEDTRDFPVIEKQFRFNANDIMCHYVVRVNRCHIYAPTINTFSVECNSIDDFTHIITFVACIAKNGCGSLKSCGRNNKASVRGLKESVFSYVKTGCPPVFELEVENVVLT